MFAYFLAGAHGATALDDPRMAPLLCGGPYQFASVVGGAIAFAPGASHSVEDYGPGVDVGDGVRFLPPKSAISIYDLAREDCHGGVPVRLAAGPTVSIPVALVQHRQFVLGRGKPEVGAPVSEYGRLATALCERAGSAGGVQLDDSDLGRLIVLAMAQHYRVTAHMIDHLGVVSVDDVDPILGAAWTGDPKALAPASADGGRSSPASDSTGAT